MILLVLIALAARASAAAADDPIALAVRYANALTGAPPDAPTRTAAVGDAESDDEDDREDEDTELAHRRIGGSGGSRDAAADRDDRADADPQGAAHGTREVDDTGGDVEPPWRSDDADAARRGALSALDSADAPDAWLDGSGEPASDASGGPIDDASSPLVSEPADDAPWTDAASQPSAGSQTDDQGQRSWSIPTVPLEGSPGGPVSQARPPRWGRLDVGLSWRRRWSEPRHAPARRAHEVWLFATWRR